MYSEHLIPVRNLQGLNKDGENIGEGKHKTYANPVTSKTASSSPTLTCTSKSTSSTAVVTAQATTCNSRQLSTQPSTSKSAPKSGKQLEHYVYSYTADSSQYAILTIHLYIPPVHVYTTYRWIILGVKRPRCSCEGCSLSDCGVCSNCCDMKKFGGPGRKKQRCMKRKCQFAKSVKVYKIIVWHAWTCQNVINMSRTQVMDLRK